MNNTDKLLRAFIEAQGYEIEVDYKVTKKESESYKSLRLKNLQMSRALLLITELNDDEIFDSVDLAKEALTCDNA